jgi:hypothetical protein
MKAFKGKRFSFLFLILILIAWASPAYVAEKSYKIGVNLEFTGPWAEVTKTVRNAMVLEVERINKMGGIDGHPLELIFEDMPVLRNVSLSDNFIEGIVFHPGDKIDVLRTPSTPERVVGIAPVIDNDGSGSKIQLSSHLHIRNLPFGDESKFGKVPVMIQKQVKLDGSLGLAELGPIKHGQTQINGARIHTDQFVLEPERFLDSHLPLASFQKPKKHLLIQFPGTVFIRIGQGGAAGSRETKMLQLPFTASQPSGNLPEGMGTAQLTKEHGHKLAPAAKSSGMSFGFRFFHGLKKLGFGKEL